MIFKTLWLLLIVSHQTNSQSIFFIDSTITAALETTTKTTTTQQETTTRPPAAQAEYTTAAAAATTTTTIPLRGLRCASKIDTTFQMPPYCSFSSVSGEMKIVGTFDEVLPHAFDGLDVKWLDLSGLSIKKLNPDSFYGLGNLNVLYLDNNLLESIPDATFLNLNGLKNLHIKNNQLTKLTPGMLQGLEYLNELSFFGNNISTIEESTFSFRSTNLRKLNLGENKISKIDKSNFAGLRELLDLNLAQNLLTTIDFDTFDNLTLLETLNISHNSIEFLTNDIFSKQMNLKVLDASYNKIQEIGQSVFKGKRNLNQIFLNNNQLTQITDYLFENMDGMTTLNLQNNRINKISSNTLSGLRELKYLFLGNNLIEHLPTGWLDAAGNLNTIDLSNNLISSIDSGPFNTPTRLQFLNLNNNKLVRLLPGWFETNDDLLELNLRNNGLTSFDPNAFSNQPRLSTLDLGNNSLKRESLIEAFSKFTQLQTLYLDGNPLTTFNADEAKCPASLKQLYLNATCLEQVTIMGFSSLKRIDLQQNYLPSVSSGDISGLNSLEFFDLSDNNITRLEASFLSVSTQLKVLNLTFNMITQNDIPSIPMTMVTAQTTIDLSWNRITDLSVFPAFKRFYIAGNPLKCACNNLPEWNELSAFADHEKTICQTSTKQNLFLTCFLSDVITCPSNAKPRDTICSSNPEFVGLDRPIVYKKSCKFPRPVITDFVANITESGFKMSWNASNLDSLSWFLLKWDLQYNDTTNATAFNNTPATTKQFSTVWPKSQSFSYSNNLDRAGVSNVCIETVPVYNTIPKDIKCLSLHFPGPAQQTSKLFPMLTYILIAIGLVLLLLLILIIIAVCLRKRRNRRQEKEYLERERKKKELERNVSVKSVIDPNLPQGIPEQSTVSIDMY